MTDKTPGETGNDLTRVTVNLIPAAADALEESASRDRLSKTDVVNRALAVYNHIGRIEQSGGELRVVLANGSTAQLIII